MRKILLMPLLAATFLFLLTARLLVEAGAISAMVAGGGTRIVKIAVAGGSSGEASRACTPCGGCRQRIDEFADENTRIIVKDNDENWHSYSVAELLPSSFHL